MIEKGNNTGLFTSFKDVLNKVQADVALGIELIRCRNQYEGLHKCVNNLYRELGEKVYNLYKSDKDPISAVKEKFDELKSKELEMSAMKRKIAQLEEKTASKLQLLGKKTAEEKTEDESSKDLPQKASRKKTTTKR